MKNQWLTHETFLALKTTTNQMNQYIVVMGLPVAQRLHVGPKREEIAFYLQARERCCKEHLENGGIEASVPGGEAL